MPLPPYDPIPCGFYDRLEVAAMRGTPVALTVVDAEGRPQPVSARIRDLQARDGADWADVEGHGWVRLDRIAALDGAPSGAACAVAPQPSAR